MSVASVEALQAAADGALRAVATYDRDGIELHAANGKYSGVFVSVDTGADVNLERLADIRHQSGA